MYICYDCECEHYKNNEPCIDDYCFCEKTIKEHDDRIRSKAIDEFASWIVEKYDTVPMVDKEYIIEHFMIERGQKK